MGTWYISLAVTLVGRVVQQRWAERSHAQDFLAVKGMTLMGEGGL